MWNVGKCPTKRKIRKDILLHIKKNYFQHCTVSWVWFLDCCKMWVELLLYSALCSGGIFHQYLVFTSTQKQTFYLICFNLLSPQLVGHLCLNKVTGIININIGISLSKILHTKGAKSGDKIMMTMIHMKMKMMEGCLLWLLLGGPHRTHSITN